MPTDRMAKVVVSRFLEARATKNYEFLNGLFKDLREVWHKLPKSNWWGPGYAKVSKPDSEMYAKEFARASGKLLKELKFTAENPFLAKAIKKYEGKLRLLRKMLKAWSEAKDYEELQAVLESQGTKSKNAWQKFIEYEDRVLGLIRGLDTEAETTINMGPYRVTLMTAHHDEWDAEKVKRLQYVLEKVDGTLSRMGLKSLAGGKVFAFPSKRVPGSGAALATYHTHQGVFEIAAEGKVADLISVMLHEMGHKAYYTLVEGRGRTAWSDFFEGGLGTPDVDSIIETWERSLEKIDNERDRHRGRFLAYYMQELMPKGDEGDAMWLNMLARQLGIKEKFNPWTGAVSKKSVPGLDQLIANRHKAKVFLYPVTAYSGTNASELFAETFMDYATGGGRRVHPLVAHAFRMTLPKFKMAQLLNEFPSIRE